MILHASHDDRRFRIEKTDAGYYLFVFERERCTHDYLQNTLVLAKECARGLSMVRPVRFPRVGAA